MKKIMAIVCAMAVAVSCMAVSVFADAENLALSGTAIADSVHATYNTNLIEYLNDGDILTRWQSNSKMVEAGNEAPTYETAPWAGIYWDEAQTFNTVVFWFEASNPTVDGFEVYIAEEYAGEETVWTLVEGTVTRDTENCGGTDPNNDNDSTDTVVFAEAVTAEAVKVVGYIAENKNVDLSIWEIEVFNAEVAAAGNSLTGTFEAATETEYFVATNVAVEDMAEGDVIVAEYTITRNGATVSDSIVITEAWASITLGDLAITSDVIDGGREGDYVVGVLFTNVDAADEIVVTFSIV